MESRVRELENIAAFQEQTIKELNAAILDLYKKMAALDKHMRLLNAQLSEESSVRPIEDEEKPPHY